MIVLALGPLMLAGVWFGSHNVDQPAPSPVIRGLPPGAIIEQPPRANRQLGNDESLGIEIPER